MSRLIAFYLANFSKGFISKVLGGAGLGLFTYAVLETFGSFYINRVVESSAGIGTVTGLLALSGVPQALSMILSAFAASFYIKTFATGLRLGKS